jgi:hypothetical protein
MELTKKNIPIGWNALLDRSNNVALIIGEVKAAGPHAFTKLELLTKPTETELLAATEGFVKKYPMKKNV